jgi:hypothetical protein
MINIITNLNSLPVGSVAYALGYESITMTHPNVTILPDLACLIPMVDAVTAIIEDNAVEANRLFRKQLDDAKPFLVRLLGSSEPIFIYVTQDEFDMGYLEILHNYIRENFDIILGIPSMNVDYQGGKYAGLRMLESSYAIGDISPSMYIEAVRRFGYINQVIDNPQFELACKQVNYQVNDIKTASQVPILRRI